MITEEDAMSNTTAPGDLKLMLKGMVRAPGTGSMPKIDLGEDPRAEDPAPADPNRSGGVPKVAVATGSGAIPAVKVTPAASGIRAPIRPTGRQGTPAAQRPPQPTTTTPPAQQPGAPGTDTKPKIQRGFDFQK